MGSDKDKLDRVVAEARRARELRERDYRAQALKMYSHVCGRCGREFDRNNLHQLTVHHRDHDHDHNPEDGSNWELLCLYCHDNEHQRQLDAQQGSLGDGDGRGKPSGHKAFADLRRMLDDKQDDP